MPREDAKQEESVLRLVQAVGVLTLDEVVDRFPGLSWKQIFEAVDALNRRGDIVLRLRNFQYELQAKHDPAHM